MTNDIEKTPVIYIMGGARSGSTLIDIVLGDLLQGTSCGEIRKYCDLKGIPQDPEGNPKAALFWKKVANHPDISWIFSCIEDLSVLTRNYEYHTAVPKRLFYKGDFDNSTCYEHYVKFLFSVLTRVTNRGAVIDSSKYPGRALSLSRYIKDRVFIIFLIRDPVSVVHSFQKKNIEQPASGFIKANLYYFLNTFLCLLVYMRISKHQKKIIFYKDFVNAPCEMAYYLAKEMCRSGFDIQPEMPLQKKYFNVGPLFDGNRLRLLEEIEITRPEKPKVGFFQSIITWFINGLPYFIVLILSKCYRLKWKEIFNSYKCI